ncbi:MAG: bifunctional (p)ppGpp synthetase/guanosine-3',5'-bis(diphosphate) 3'-pyrophosphohydrolase [Bradymonadales bacterium]|nr:bifunctional (p)ppGpp synthetase/guanosine-3',5'-bis(diphosphate) 3'-pyrophosphohydrolase [Bradymonadales bacterium]
MAEPRIEVMYETLVKKVRAYHPNPQLELLRKSYEFADRAHQGQKRSSGEPYLTHPIGVADIIADLKLDIASLCAGLLHDVVEDTSFTMEDLTVNFNSEIAYLVDGVTKLSKLRFNTSEERQAETIRKMIVAMSRDLRVVLVKLSDRLHNMRTLDFLEPSRQRRIAQETMDIYAPLANRFGINWVKTELEDSAFRSLEREAYYELARKVAKKKKERERYVKDVIAVLRKAAEDGHLSAEVQGRPKHFYSIWRKMQAREVEIDEIYDIVAFRILVNETNQCYEALGIVHNLWRPLPARFKDYIAMPKPNGYQSLHTSVIGPYMQPIEIQIRTQEMHQIAEEGVAAHWVYKEGKASPVQDVSKFTWLRQLIEDFQEVSDPKDFLERLKLDLFAEEVFIFTPKGDIRALPVGATVVDFAYAIHTEVGNHCAGAKVNNQIVPLHHELKSGDMVEILTRPNQHPNKDWLEHVKTGRARSKIKHYLLTEARERAIELGQEYLDTELRKHGTSLKAVQKKGQLKEVLELVRLQTTEEMFIKLGYGTLSVGTVVKKLIPDLEKKESAPPPPESTLGQISQRVKKIFSRRTGVRVDGVDDDLMVRYARCCAPIPGDEIIGFITRGRGLTVHRADCPRIDYLESERQIEVHWDERSIKDQNITRLVRVEVITRDERGLLAEMTAAFSTAGINIHGAHCEVKKAGGAVNIFDLMVTDRAQLDRALDRVARLAGVIKVTRVRN